MSALERDIYAHARHNTPPSVPEQSAAASAIVLHVTAPTLCIPVALAQAWCEGGITRLEAWKEQAGGAQLAVYTAFKGVVNLGMPMIAGLLDSVVSAGVLPPLPARPRHSDPILYLARYIAHALPTAAARAPWTLVADPATGRVSDLEWGGVSLTADLHTAEGGE